MHELEQYGKRDLSSPIYQPSCLDILKLWDKRGNSMLPSKREFYKDLKEKFPQLKKYTDAQIHKHIKEFNEYIAETIVSDRNGLMLPANMGLVMICTMGKRTNAVDHKTSTELGKTVHFTNDWSESFGGGLYYSTNQTKEGKANPERLYTNCEYWYMSCTKNLKLAICKAYKTDWKIFYALPKSRRYIDMVDTYQKKLKTKKVIREIKDTYNEFDFSKKVKKKTDE